MSAFEIANEFFIACESAKGWKECKEYAEPNATFSAQCEPIAAMPSLEEYCDWMMVNGIHAFPDASYDLHASAYDEATMTALFFGTYHAKHDGDGGPVPPTHKETHSEYVYAIKMNENQKVESMIKIWNSNWSLKELGWD